MCTIKSIVVLVAVGLCLVNAAEEQQNTRRRWPLGHGFAGAYGGAFPGAGYAGGAYPGAFGARGFAHPGGLVHRGFNGGFGGYGAGFGGYGGYGVAGIIHPGAACHAGATCGGGSFCYQSRCCCPTGMMIRQTTCVTTTTVVRPPVHPCAAGLVFISGGCRPASFLPRGPRLIVPQALPAMPCGPNIECSGGSICQAGICCCPPGLQNQGTVCVVPAVYRPFIQHVPVPAPVMPVVPIAPRPVPVFVGHPCGPTVTCVTGAVCRTGVCACGYGYSVVGTGCMRRKASA